MNPPPEKQFPEGSWVVDLGSRDEQEELLPAQPGKWPGHLVAVVHTSEGPYLVDLSIKQAERPYKGILISKPLVFKLPPNFSSRGYTFYDKDENLVFSYMPYPRDKSFEKTSGWIRPHKEEIESFLAKVEEHRGNPFAQNVEPRALRRRNPKTAENPFTPPYQLQHPINDQIRALREHLGLTRAELGTLVADNLRDRIAGSKYIKDMAVGLARSPGRYIKQWEEGVLPGFLHYHFWVLKKIAEEHKFPFKIKLEPWSKSRKKHQLKKLWPHKEDMKGDFYEPLRGKTPKKKKAAKKKVRKKKKAKKKVSRKKKPSYVWNYCPYCSEELESGWVCCPYCGKCRNPFAQNVERRALRRWNPDEPKGVPKHIYHKKGAKTVCTSAVLAAFEIDSCSYHYSGTLKQRLNLLRKNGWAARSRNSHIARGFRKLKIKSGAKSVGKVRKIIAHLNKDEPEINAWGDPLGTRYMIRIEKHALLLDYHGKTIVDTDPRLRDKRKVSDIRAVFRPAKDDLETD